MGKLLLEMSKKLLKFGRVNFQSIEFLVFLQHTSKTHTHF